MIYKLITTIQFILNTKKQITNPQKETRPPKHRKRHRVCIILLSASIIPFSIKKVLIQIIQTQIHSIIEMESQSPTSSAIATDNSVTRVIKNIAPKTSVNLKLALDQFNCHGPFQSVFPSYESFESDLVQTSDQTALGIEMSGSILSDDNLLSTSSALSANSNTTLRADLSGSQSISKSSKSKRSLKSHTPRPPNSFILYRRDKHAEITTQNRGAKALNNNVISKIVATMWKQETAEVKAIYSAKAEEEKRAHMIKFPDYKYQPRKSIKKDVKPIQKERQTKPVVIEQAPAPSTMMSNSYGFCMPFDLQYGWTSEHDLASTVDLNQSVQQYSQSQLSHSYGYNPLDCAFPAEDPYRY